MESPLVRGRYHSSERPQATIQAHGATFWARTGAHTALAGTGHSMGERWPSFCLELPGNDGRYAHTSLFSRNRLHSASSRDPAQEAMDTVRLYSGIARPGTVSIGYKARKGFPLARRF